MSHKIKLSIKDGKLVADPDEIIVMEGEKIKWKFVHGMIGYKFYLSGKSNNGEEIFQEGVQPHKKDKIEKNVKQGAKLGAWEYNIHLFKDETEVYVLDPKIVIEPTKISDSEKKLIAVVSVILLACVPFAIRYFQRRSR